LQHQFLKTMKLFYEIALVIHIISGFSALVAGLLAIISKKGKNLHLKTGSAFYYSMLLVAVTSVSISILKSNMFLLHIGIFSFFMVYSGHQSIKNKSLKPGLIDWVVFIIAVVNSAFMIYSLQVILIVFGGIGLSLAITDLRIFISVLQKKEIAKNQWLLRHIGMMLGSYIATFTAFLVVSLNAFSYGWVVWLMPTIIGTPLIIYWTMKYSIKKKRALSNG